MRMRSAHRLPIWQCKVMTQVWRQMQVIIYTRQGCPLCDDGIAMARSVLGDANVALVDVDLDLELIGKYTNRVPVIETVDGAVIAEGAIVEESLRIALEEMKPPLRG